MISDILSNFQHPSFVYIISCLPIKNVSTYSISSNIYLVIYSENTPIKKYELHRQNIGSYFNLRNEIIKQNIIYKYTQYISSI
jgi:hypothetical protein